MSEVWKKTQERQLQDYKKGNGVFSETGNKSARRVGILLNSVIPNMECLDVGCGILPLPEYMRYAPDVKFTGIDPYKGGERKFKFVKGLAEKMPFEDASFDAVLYATSLDHLLNPKRAINETFRVLRENGYLFIWGTFHNKRDRRYILWEQTKALNIYEHPWAFTLSSIGLLMNRFKLGSVVDITIREKILTYRKNG